MDVVCVKERKLNKHVREGFRILARIIARKYLKNQAKIHDGEIAGEKRSILRLKIQKKFNF
jgi:hypothetical protein